MSIRPSLSKSKMATPSPVVSRMYRFLSASPETFSAVKPASVAMSRKSIVGGAGLDEAGWTGRIGTGGGTSAIAGEWDDREKASQQAGLEYPQHVRNDLIQFVALTCRAETGFVQVRRPSATAPHKLPHRPQHPNPDTNGHEHVAP